jgi:hypothetical protein
MSHNTFGHLFRVTTRGESHGPARARSAKVGTAFASGTRSDFWDSSTIQRSGDPAWSHRALGCVVDGCPPGIRLGPVDIQVEVQAHRDDRGAAASRSPKGTRSGLS